MIANTRRKSRIWVVGKGEATRQERKPRPVFGKRGRKIGHLSVALGELGETFLLPSLRRRVEDSGSPGTLVQNGILHSLNWVQKVENVKWGGGLGRIKYVGRGLGEGGKATARKCQGDKSRVSKKEGVRWHIGSKRGHR